jgi:uncharacterized protein YjbJ (UPF0337 family)
MKNDLVSVEKWNIQKEKLKKEYEILTDKDVLWIEGRVDTMLERIQAKLGKSKEEIKKIIMEL